MGTEIQPTTLPIGLAWLGAPLVTYAGQTLAFRTRKATALLAYLTVEGGVHTREKLTTLFWPESNTTRGRGMLRTSLAYLRETLDAIDTWTGKHSGEFMGVPATHRQVTIKGIDIFRLTGGEIVDLWQEIDLMGIVQQVIAQPPLDSQDHWVSAIEWVPLRQRHWTSAPVPGRAWRFYWQSLLNAL